MIKFRLKFGAAAILLSTLFGCGSTPTSNHYLLTASISSAPAGQTPALGIGPIEIPEYLNRPTLVYSAGGNQLTVPTSERWAEPLADGIARVLSLNLAGLLNTENVQAYPWHPQQAPDFGVRVRVLGLDADAKNASLIAEWVVYRPDGSAAALRRISQLQEPLVSAPPEALPAAYSVLLYRLSELIAGSIAAAAQGERPDPA